MIFIPYILTFFIGFFALKALIQNDKTINAPLFFCLSCLIGIAESIFICFFSLIFLKQFHIPFITILHIIEIILLFFITKQYISFTHWRTLLNKCNITFICFLIFCGLLATLYAKTYPYGGWDAWQVWNFKAKFIFLSGEHWKNLFNPLLWRSSPHYPLALPLFNAWTWSFSNGTPASIPLINTVIFNMLIGGLMFSFLRPHYKNKFTYIPAAFLFFIPSYMVLATSQYCDVFLSLFFLASLISIHHAHTSQKNEFLLLGGIFLGLLSFTKPEGFILAGIVFLGSQFHLFQKENKKEKFSIFWISSLIAGIPTMLFLLFLSPGNQTFINGLTSTTNPSTLMRLKIIMAFLLIEMSHIKWGFLWWLILLAGILNLNRIFKKDFFIFFFSIISYLLIVLTYYWTNTYFKIDWWLSVSLSRILSSLLPAIIVWISLGILTKKNDADS